MAAVMSRDILLWIVPVALSQMGEEKAYLNFTKYLGRKFRRKKVGSSAK